MVFFSFFRVLEFFVSSLALEIAVVILQRVLDDNSSKFAADVQCSLWPLRQLQFLIQLPFQLAVVLISVIYCTLSLLTIWNSCACSRTPFCSHRKVALTITLASFTVNSNTSQQAASEYAAG